MISRRTSLFLLIVLTVTMILICCILPRIPQPQSYHHFADQRALFGVPNFGDVVSNLPFAVIGFMGLSFVLRTKDDMRFSDRRERWPYAVAFIGLLLTAFGSSYYHLAPDNARLVWDRLPMTITFMGMVSAVIVERIDLQLGMRLLPVLLLIGLGSVLQWYWSEARGAGDLRFYAAVQAYSALVILLSLLFPKRYTRTADFGWVIAFYALAKVLEYYDRPIFAVLHIVSGHTLKHLAAGAAGYCILRMVEKRRPIAMLNATLVAQI